MAEVSLNVLIAGRTYPLILKHEDEKVAINVAKMINDKMKEIEENYSVRDKQDLLAMSALQLLTTQLTIPEKLDSLENELVNQLDLFVTDYLQKESNS